MSHVQTSVDTGTSPVRPVVFSHPTASAPAGNITATELRLARHDPFSTPAATKAPTSGTNQHYALGG